jgi:signal transduction histidine kinase
VTRRVVPPVALDAALALGLLAVTIAETVGAPGDGVSDAWNLLAAAALTLPLLWRRRAPLAVTGVVLASAVLVNVALPAFVNVGAPFGAMLLGAYSIGAHAEGRANTAGGLAGALLTAPVSAVLPAPTVSDFVFPMLFFAAAWAAGRTVRHRTQLAGELHEAAVRAREEREAEEARAVAEERRRIARELHDVVAHSLSVMVVQAGGARRILGQDPGRAEEAAARIEATGRAALGEMRRLLGVLHRDEEPALAPQPTLAALDGLVERARAAGLGVALVQTGTPRPLPAGVDLTAYRVVQEGLTNALKHAGPVATEVRLRWEDDGLALAVLSAPGRAGAGGGTGHGLIGMRERVALCGGDLAAGPRPGGGFAVEARLPAPAAVVPA